MATGNNPRRGGGRANAPAAATNVPTAPAAGTPATPAAAATPRPQGQAAAAQQPVVVHVHNTMPDLGTPPPSAPRATRTTTTTTRRTTLRQVLEGFGVLVLVLLGLMLVLWAGLYAYSAIADLPQRKVIDDRQFVGVGVDDDRQQPEVLPPGRPNVERLVAKPRMTMVNAGTLAPKYDGGFTTARLTLNIEGEGPRMVTALVGHNGGIMADCALPQSVINKYGPDWKSVRVSRNRGTEWFSTYIQ